MNNAMKNWSGNPTTINITRSKQKMGHSHKLTYNTGHLYPVYWRDVIPGSTVKMDVSQITRMQTPIFPIMDNCFQDLSFFFVPYRLLWDHFEEFMGENKTGFWEQKTEYEVPQIIFNSQQTIISNVEGQTPVVPKWIKGDSYYPYCVQAGSLADYMGIPIVDANTTTPSARGEFEVQALPFRAYWKVFNDWFRDENVGLPMDYDTGDSDVTAYMGSSDAEASNVLTPPPYVSKFHDYFTSALPQPQKHDDIVLPVGTEAPVIGNGIAIGLTDGTQEGGLQVSATAKTLKPNTGAWGVEIGTGTAGSDMTGGAKGWGLTTEAENSGLVADLSQMEGISINTLRQAFAIQQFYEAQARGGSRYIEQLNSMFSVISPDARLQRSEYLGGTRNPININQVVQTSETGDNTPQGNVAAYSLTTSSNEMFTKSFTEHGIIIGVMCIRLEHSYQDGLNRMWLKKNIFDFPFPVFQGIGDQAILNKEIYLAGDVLGSKDDEAFGYQERYAEYRYMQNRVSGEFRSKYHQTLDAWHFADDYHALPTLSFAWMNEYEDPLNRNIAVEYQNADQWMSDIFFEETWTQPLAAYSIPGLTKM